MKQSESASGFLSPSLGVPRDGEGAAYELKFLIDDRRACEVEEWAGGHLVLDPHGDPSRGGAYQTTSIYCDTATLDVYHRSPSFRRRKFRVRRYGAAEAIFFERKSKSGDRVAKRRSQLSRDELPQLSHPSVPPEWAGFWFHRSLQVRRLRPACRIVYERTAYVGNSYEGPLRLTLDRQIRGTLIDDWSIATDDPGIPLLTGSVILELKFRTALPSLFKALVQQMSLGTSAVSKYRICQQAFGREAPRNLTPGE